MPKGEHLPRVRLSKAQRVALLGQTPLAPGEKAGVMRIRLPQEVYNRFEKLSPLARGEVIMAGFKALEEAPDGE